jgi:hypothetical protein
MIICVIQHQTLFSCLQICLKKKSCQAGMIERMINQCFNFILHLDNLELKHTSYRDLYCIFDENLLK